MRDENSAALNDYEYEQDSLPDVECDPDDEAAIERLKERLNQPLYPLSESELLEIAEENRKRKELREIGLSQIKVYGWNYGN